MTLLIKSDTSLMVCVLMPKHDFELANIMTTLLVSLILPHSSVCPVKGMPLHLLFFIDGMITIASNSFEIVLFTTLQKY